MSAFKLVELKVVDKLVETVFRCQSRAGGAARVWVRVVHPRSRAGGQVRVTNMVDSSRDGGAARALVTLRKTWVLI